MLALLAGGSECVEERINKQRHLCDRNPTRLSRHSTKADVHDRFENDFHTKSAAPLQRLNITGLKMIQRLN